MDEEHSEINVVGESDEEEDFVDFEEGFLKIYKDVSACFLKHIWSYFETILVFLCILKITSRSKG